MRQEKENPMRTSSMRAAPLLAAAALLAAGCTGPSARVKSDDEGTLVDATRGGTETYKELIRKGVTDMLQEHRLLLSATAAEKPMVAFVGVENRSSEELGEFRSAMNNEITTALVNSRLYTMLSMRAVDAAKREANVRDVADLTTARNRESFLSVLNRDGQPPQYLLFGEVTTMSSRGAGERERTYQLTLQMMDSSNGVIQTQKLVEVRKAYE
jgi:hypothetical protein